MKKTTPDPNQSPDEKGWHKSSYSGVDACVEVAIPKGSRTVLVRDSKDPNAGILGFTPEEWTAFLLGAKDGEFDLPQA